MSRRALLAEALGSAILFATVVRAGRMVERLGGGTMALALLGATVATGAILLVLITMFAPVSGAHLNPAVIMVMRLARPRDRALGEPHVAQLADRYSERRAIGVAVHPH